jgi:monofunctional biosynthetic peptidoglycan transglycosylase
VVTSGGPNYRIALAAFCALALGLGIVWWLSPGEDLGPWREGPPPEEWAALSRQETLWRGEGLSRDVNHEYVPLQEISVELPLAVLVGEDIAFFRHGTVDPVAIWEALREWWRGARLRGASTISQQLARILFLSNRRSLTRKFREARMAWWLERRLGKRRVLELYLNVVEYGPGVFGAQAAAQKYFGVPASRLDPEQAAGLAAAIPSPGRDNPSTATDRWRARRALILDRASRADWLRRTLEHIREKR